MSRRTEKCHICQGTGLITVDNWLIEGMTEEEIAKEKQEALADIVEVVRCKNCKMWDKDNIEKHTYSSEDSTLVDFAECSRWSDWAKCRMTRYNDYCSCAERRQDDNT